MVLRMKEMEQTELVLKNKVWIKNNVWDQKQCMGSKARYGIKN